MKWYKDRTLNAQNLYKNSIDIDNIPDIIDKMS